jgi:two-component system chemotaxis response regulator CheB
VTALIGVGASLGGLRALSVVLSGLPRDLDAAILVVQHRRADGDSLLAELLARDSALPVREADDKMAVEPGCVYLAPSDYHLLVEDDGSTLALSTEAPLNYARPSMDVLFDSLARCRVPQRTAVLLTSASDDGARGAVALQRAGGRLLVQDPADCESPVLPRALLARTTPDALLPLAQIAGTLIDLHARRT